MIRKAWDWFVGGMAAHGPLILSSLITLFALLIYFTTFVGARTTPFFAFIDRLELASLDYRFQLRGPQQPDSHIMIVEIDQRAQDVLGRWPFPRSHFATLLDRLREDGAAVAAFDITFSQPDRFTQPIEELRTRLAKKGAQASPQVRHEIESVRSEFDHDARLAKAIEDFGRVILGNFFLFTEFDLGGMTAESLQRSADLIANHPFPQVRPIGSAHGAEDMIHVIQIMDDVGLVPAGAEANIEPLTLSLPGDIAGAGYFNIFPDSDGVVRHYNLALPYGPSEDLNDWSFYAPLSVQAVRVFLKLPNDKVTLQYGSEGMDSLSFDNLVIRPDFLGRVLINYRGEARTYPYISMGKVVRGDFPPGTFKDKIVLVGASATGIGDLRLTPFAKLNFPGVEVHANVIDNILNNSFLQRGAMQVSVDLVMILLFGVPVGLALVRVEPRRMPFALFLLIPFSIGVQFAFTRGWWLNAVTPSLFTLIPTTALVGLQRVLLVERERRRTQSTFQQYLSPEVVRRLLKNPKSVEPRKIELTIMFTDVRGFTSLSEDLDAQEVADLLNHYLNEMTRVVFRHQGTLDKYMGDGILAFWGAPFEEPLHAPKACQSALGMLEKLKSLQVGWESEGKPRMDIGIGIHTGVASVGHMGSQLRYAYTVVGDAVNLSSRLEGMNKLYGTRVLVSEETRRKCSDSGLLFRELDWIRVTGKKQHVTIFELAAAGNHRDDWTERIEVFENGLRCYRQRDWSTAYSCFERLLERWPEDGPAQLFLGRCEEYLVTPPPSYWDGIFTAKQK